MNIDAVIISGGNIERDFALDFLKKNRNGNRMPFLIAADRGLEFFAEAGIRPNAAVGDFDSLSQEGRIFLERLQSGGLEIKELRPEKDDSDTQSALMLAADKGFRSVALLGATGTRVDHVLANLGLLALGAELGLCVSIVDARNYITLVKSGTVLHKNQQFGKFVSFFSLGGDVEGLTLEGFYYPLNGHHLRARDSGLTVSNEITADTARVTYAKGQLLMIMSRD